MARLSLLCLIVSVLILGCIGWVLNIVHICHHASEAITGVFIVQCVGIIVAPLGAVMGWVTG